MKELKGANVFIGLCLNKKSIFSRNFSVSIPFIYKYEIKELVDSFKFYRDLKGAKTLVSKLLSVLDMSKLENIDYIVPSPSHFFENTMRGYETMSYFAHLLSCSLNISQYNILKKNFFPLFKRTQKGRTRLQRLSNFGMFSIKKNVNIKDKNILLIDDVWTTGTTIKGLVDLLYFNGASSVQVLVIALA